MQTVCSTCERSDVKFYPAHPDRCRSCIKRHGTPDHFICTRCGVRLPLADKVAGKSTCRPCHRDVCRARQVTPAERAERAAYARRWRAERPDYSRERSLLASYGITIADYERMLVEQHGRCAICRTDVPGNARQRYFHVDHCHDTGKVRGLLCGPCNVGIGMFKESSGRLRAALAYLEQRQ